MAVTRRERYLESGWTESGAYPGLSGWWVALLLLATPVVLYWRPAFFFIRDDWRTLALLADLPWRQFVLAPEGEQWFPFFHLVYAGLIVLAKDNYPLLLLVSCLATGLTAFLLYLFYLRLLSPAVALALSLFYAVAAPHSATAPMLFYLCYSISLTCLLGALLLAQRYLEQPSALNLMGVGLCALLSTLSHNYTLLALPALGLYPWIAAERPDRRRLVSLGLVSAAVTVVYLVGYGLFAGFKAATSLHQSLFQSLPDSWFFLHWWSGAFASPSYYLLWSERVPAVTGATLGTGVFLLLLFPICRWGNRREKRLALWLALLNGLPFLAVSLARAHLSLGQAFSPRYGFFTLAGILLLAGVAWRIMSRTFPLSPAAHRLVLLVLAAEVAFGHLLYTPKIFRQYQEESRLSRQTYHRYSSLPADDLAALDDDSRNFLMSGSDFPVLTRGQILVIRLLLKNPNGKPS